MEQKISIGRTVHYMLTVNDANRINDARSASYPTIHGNFAHAGDVYPFLVTRLWVVSPDAVQHVNGQVFLDGNDALWVTSVIEGNLTPGTWFWPPRS